MKTVANQRIVTVHREQVTSDFLGIKNDNWTAAARDLGAHALLLYLYFAANRDKYTMALSPAAIRQEIGMPPQTYRDQFHKLLDKGYLVQKGANSYDFYERPQRAEKSVILSTENVFQKTSAVNLSPSDVMCETVIDREINIDNINIHNAHEKQVSHVGSQKKNSFVF